MRVVAHAQFSGWCWGNSDDSGISVINLLVSTHLRKHAGGQHAVNFLHLLRLQFLQNSSSIWLRILSIALEEEQKVLDFVS